MDEILTRIIDENRVSEARGDDYVLIDSESEGVRIIKTTNLLNRQMEPEYNWYYNEDKTLVVREKISDGSFRWYFNDYVEAGTPLPASDTNHWIPDVLASFFIQQSSMPITVTDSQGRNWTCNTVKLMSDCTIQPPSGSPVNGKATLIVGTTFHAQARGYSEYGGNLQNGTIRAIIESSDMTNWNLTGSQSNGTAFKTVSHEWEEPTFDPYNG